MYENKQRDITKKLRKQELRFMCTTLPLDEIYPPTKLHNLRSYSFGAVLRTKNWMQPARTPRVIP